MKDLQNSGKEWFQLTLKREKFAVEIHHHSKLRTS